MLPKLGQTLKHLSRQKPSRYLETLESHATEIPLEDLLYLDMSKHLWKSAQNVENYEKQKTYLTSISSTFYFKLL